MSRVIIYARQSQTDTTRESLSLASQESELRRWAERERHQVVRVLVDPDEKGADPNRPGLLELQTMLDRRTADIVAVWKMDRFARNLKLQETIVDRITEAGAALFSLREPMAADPMYRQILGAINEQQTRNQSEHTRRVIAERRGRGWHTGGRVAYGYAQPDRYGPIVPDLDHPDRIACVRLIYELRAQGLSTMAIATEITARGHEAPRGGAWPTTTVAELISNPVYIGRYNYGVFAAGATGRADRRRIEGLRVTHEAIVDDALWHAAQTVNADRNRHRSPRHKSRISWVEGLIHHHCGNPMYAVTRQGRLDLVCATMIGSRRPTVERCNVRPLSISQSRAEPAAWRAIADAIAALLPEQEVLDAAQRHWQQSEPEAIIARDRLTVEIAQLEVERARIERMYRTGRRDDVWFDREDAAVSDRLVAARIDLDNLPAAPDPGEISATWRSIDSLRDAIDHITQPDDRRRVLAELGTIRVDAAGETLLIPSPSIASYLPPPPVHAAHDQEDWPERVRAVRLRYGLSTTQLAIELGVTRRTVNSWESGQYLPNYPYPARLDALSVRLAEEAGHANDG
jgi:DNA invertase Pin-like site-specific DNA recombinase